MRSSYYSRALTLIQEPSLLFKSPHLYPPLRDEALVNFEKKSERLTLHGVTGFIPHVLHVPHVLQALPVLLK